MNTHPKVEAWSIGKLVTTGCLRIPDYQRPYKWSTRNVAELVEDVQRFTPKGTYRIGTVIVHEHAGMLDVVDGQQRLTSLHLLARVLGNPKISAAFNGIARLQLSPHGLEQTKTNLRQNRDFLTRLVAQWNDHTRSTFTEALFRKCEVVVVTLLELDEAFQMFDSQNARGKELYPTDLLKAFHLREISDDANTSKTKRQMVGLWEDIPATHINALFSEYLFKIRRWANGRSVPKQGFTDADVDIFKGIRERDSANTHNRWTHAFIYAKSFIEGCNLDDAVSIRYRLLEKIEYPHQIDHPILNGETFFRMVAHYYRLGIRLGLLAFDDGQLPETLREEFACERPKEKLAPVDRQHCSGGDRPRYAYIRGLLDAVLLYYTDRFGDQDRDRFAHFAARYVMVPRAIQYAVKRETIDNYVLEDREKMNLFQEIREATTTSEIVMREILRPQLYGSQGGQWKVNQQDAKVLDDLWPIGGTA